MNEETQPQQPQEEEGNRRQCSACGIWSPVFRTNYTLISRNYGWRLSRRVVDGKRIMEWRCPDCWKKHRQQIKEGSAGS